MGYRTRWFGLGLRELLRVEWCRHCVLWIVRLPCRFDIPDCATTERLPLVQREQTNGPAIPRIDRGGILRVLCTAAPLGDLRWTIGGNSDQCLLDWSSA